MEVPPSKPIMHGPPGPSASNAQWRRKYLSAVRVAAAVTTTPQQQSLSAETAGPPLRPAPPVSTPPRSSPLAPAIDVGTGELDDAARSAASAAAAATARGAPGASQPIPISLAVSKGGVLTATWLHDAPSSLADSTPSESPLHTGTSSARMRHGAGPHAGAPGFLVGSLPSQSQQSVGSPGGSVGSESSSVLQAIFAGGGGGAVKRSHPSGQGAGSSHAAPHDASLAGRGGGAGVVPSSRTRLSAVDSVVSMSEVGRESSPARPANEADEEELDEEGFVDDDDAAAMWNFTASAGAAAAAPNAHHRRRHSLGTPDAPSTPTMMSDLNLHDMFSSPLGAARHASVSSGGKGRGARRQHGNMSSGGSRGRGRGGTTLSSVTGRLAALQAASSEYSAGRARHAAGGMIAGFVVTSLADRAAADSAAAAAAAVAAAPAGTKPDAVGLSVVDDDDDAGRDPDYDDDGDDGEEGEAEDEDEDHYDGVMLDVPGRLQQQRRPPVQRTLHHQMWDSSASGVDAVIVTNRTGRSSSDAPMPRWRPLDQP